MKTKDFNRYSYTELKNKATAANATQEDIDTLGAWFEEYGTEYWNGECFAIDATRSLFPIYDIHSEDEIEIAHYQIR